VSHTEISVRDTWKVAVATEGDRRNKIARQNERK